MSRRACRLFPISVTAILAAAAFALDIGLRLHVVPERAVGS